jgi:hypothetical protein
LRAAVDAQADWAIEPACTLRLLYWPADGCSQMPPRVAVYFAKLQYNVPTPYLLGDSFCAVLRVGDVNII